MKLSLKKAVMGLFIMSVFLYGVNYGIIKQNPELQAMKRGMKAHLQNEFMKIYYDMPIEKVWAHRCDSIPKMKEQIGTFEGVELDLCYFSEEGEFDVSHDLQPKLEYPLEDFLAELSGTEIKIWFDFKNLTAQNGDAALQRLNMLFDKYQLDKSKAVVESHNVEELRRFRADGWYTSFYCPVREELLKTPEGNLKFYEEVQRAVSTGNVCAVSFPIEYYPLVKKANIDADLLTWDMGSRWWDYARKAECKQLLQDNRLKAVLVTSNSRYHR